MTSSYSAIPSSAFTIVEPLKLAPGVPVPVAIEKKTTFSAPPTVTPFLSAIRTLLSNAGYVNKAPAKVVQETRDKLASSRERLDKLLAARKNLEE